MDTISCRKEEGMRSARLVLLVLLAPMALAGCELLDDGVPDEAKAFADDHWREDAYRSIEYAAAQDIIESEPFPGTAEEWHQLPWRGRGDYLPSVFTHELPLSRTDDWYTGIGKYPLQFGWGWEDWAQEQGADSTDDLIIVAVACEYAWDSSDHPRFFQSDQYEHYLRLLEE
jgi:hypothetical protein